MPNILYKNGGENMICTYDLRGVLPFVSPRIREVLKKIENFDDVCEIRIGKNMPLSLSLVSGAVFVSENGKFLNSPCGAFISDGRDIEKTLELMTNGSVYAVADEIKNGFLTLDGGYRVGICGSAVLNCGKVSYIKDISFLNIRIKREVFGCADKLAEYITAGGNVKSTLIIGEPHSGKTTVLRDLARILSDRFLYRVAVADERGEIAASVNGTAKNNVGALTCVMNMCPKRDALNMLVRSLAPEVIIVDEIGSDADFFAVKNAVMSGVSVVATKHGASFSDAEKFLKFFGCAALLSRENVGQIQKIIQTGDKYA